MPHSAPPPPDFISPHEPEIEFLGKVVHICLRVLRVFFWLFGAISVASAVYLVGNPEVQQSEPSPLPPLSQLVAHHLTWWCLGIPLLLSADWLFGRGRWLMLGVGLLLWLAPHALPGDHPYGYILRFFASLVAVSVLLVWRTVFALTRPHGEVSAPPM